jgi:hypothetical protein
LTAIDPIIGQTINNYRICARIAEGGMGTVYAAEHPFMGRRAAVKVLRPHFARDEWMVALFMNEARAANAIGHPNIIDIIDVGRLPGGQPYLMMELLAGETLADRLARVRRLPVADALDFAEQAAGALAMAHEKGIVHCDLKPENLFLVPDLGLRFGERVKVLDFGTAKLRGRDAAGRREVATAGAQEASSTAEPPPSTDATALALFGSPLYMAPEQCDERAMQGIDHRADVYALGAVLYHALCGQPPFLSDQVSEILMMHLERPPTPPRVFDPEMPEAVEAALLRALAKRPEDRFATMGELIAALRAGVSRRRTMRTTELIIRAGAAGGATPAPQLIVPSPSLALVPYRGGAGAHRQRRLRLAATAVSMSVAAAVAVVWGWPTSTAGRWTSEVRDRAASTAAKLVPLALRRELGMPPQEKAPAAPVAARPPVIVALPTPAPAEAANPGAEATGEERPRVEGRRPHDRRTRRPVFDRAVIDGEELWGRRH